MQPAKNSVKRILGVERLSKDLGYFKKCFSSNLFGFKLSNTLVRKFQRLPQFLRAILHCSHGEMVLTSCRLVESQFSLSC